MALEKIVLEGNPDSLKTGGDKVNKIINYLNQTNKNLVNTTGNTDHGIKIIYSGHEGAFRQGSVNVITGEDGENKTRLASINLEYISGLKYLEGIIDNNYQWSAQFYINEDRSSTFRNTGWLNSGDIVPTENAKYAIFILRKKDDSVIKPIEASSFYVVNRQLVNDIHDSASTIMDKINQSTEMGQLVLTSQKISHQDSDSHIRIKSGKFLWLKSGDQIKIINAGEYRFRVAHISNLKINYSTWGYQTYICDEDGLYTIEISKNPLATFESMDNIKNFMVIIRNNEIPISDKEFKSIVLGSPYEPEEYPGYIDINGKIEKPNELLNEVYTQLLSVTKGEKILLTIENSTAINFWMSYAMYDQSQNFVTRHTMIKNINLSYYRTLIDIDTNGYISFTYRKHSDGKLQVYKPNNNQNTKEKNVYSNNNIKSINHRGYNSIAPENTISSLKLSKIKGFDYVECDVNFSLDGVPVVIHDNTIDRTSNGTGQVNQMTLEQLRQYDYGSWKSAQYMGESIPTLFEYLEVAKKIGVHVYIELKENNLDLLNSIVNMVYRLGMNGHVTYISFIYSCLDAIKNIDEKARLGLVIGDLSLAKVETINSLKTGNNEVFYDAAVKADGSDKQYIDMLAEARIPLETWKNYTREQLTNIDNYITGFTTDILHAGQVIVADNLK